MIDILLNDDVKYKEYVTNNESRMAVTIVVMIHSKNANLMRCNMKDTLQK